MKKITGSLALLLGVCLLLGGCAGKSGETRTSAPTDAVPDRPVLVGDIPVSFPLTTENETLNILSVSYDGMDFDDVYVWQKYREMTGVDVNWTEVLRDERSEAVNNALSNHQKLDLILRCKLSATRLTRYGESGLLLDLAANDLLKDNAPNCWAYLQAHPETLASVMNPDGTIYGLPQVNSGAELRVSIKLFVNKTWLANVGAELPTTTEEFTRLLRAFRDEDANGNGDKTDEIPFCCANWQSAQDALYGAFGLGNRGVHNQTVDYDEVTGAVRLIAASDAYRDYLEYMHRLYSERLLDNYIFTITDAQWSNDIANDLVGVFASTNLAWLPADKADNWVAIDEALEGPRGDKLWTAIRADFHSTGAAAVPATCRDPALALRWLDYFWTDEGTLFYHMGIEGETFAIDQNGAYDYVPAIYEEMRSQNKSFDDVVATYSPYPGGSNPTVELAPYFRGGEMADVPAQAARSLFAWGPETYWPSFTFTDEENETLSTLQTDISKYCSSTQMAFVTGARPLSDWDAYLEQLAKLRTDTLLEVYQAAVDRYEAIAAQ